MKSFLSFSVQWTSKGEKGDSGPGVFTVCSYLLTEVARRKPFFLTGYLALSTFDVLSLEKIISTEMCCESLLWKEVGCTEDSTISVGETKRSIKDVTKKKTRRRTDCTTACAEGNRKLHPRGIEEM